jgi:hypothetical protein
VRHGQRWVTSQARNCKGVTLASDDYLGSRSFVEPAGWRPRWLPNSAQTDYLLPTGSVTEKFGSQTVSCCQRLRPNWEQRSARASACSWRQLGTAAEPFKHLAALYLAQPQSCHHAANVGGRPLESCRNVCDRLPFGQPHTKVRDVGLGPARGRIRQRHLPKLDHHRSVAGKRAYGH